MTPVTIKDLHRCNVLVTAALYVAVTHYGSKPDIHIYP